MAIAPNIWNLVVTVEADGKPATEYNPCDDGDVAPPDGLDFHIPDGPLAAGVKPYVVKYIEAMPGAPFRFRIVRLPQFLHHGHHVAFRYQVDNLTTGLVHDNTVTSRWKSTTWNMATSGVSLFDKKTKGEKVCGFRFQKLDIDADSTASPSEVKEQLRRSKKVGILRVYLYHVQHGNFVDYQPASGGHHLISKAAAFSEKALKGRTLDTQVSWAPMSMAVDPHRKVNEDIYRDPLKRPFAVFEFRYRTMDGLIQEGIVPRPPAKDLAPKMCEAEARHLAQEYLDLKKLSIPHEPTKFQFLSLSNTWGNHTPMDDDAFIRRYKARRLESGRIEVDFTDD
ncbi:hypothetical protein B0T14DRAFT_572499 [Immersiella caudata]|uniref:DUF7918 domain-containing protein n=1 Tax=Immersiella caudata TaxID=314043 RepID=A0AA39XDJ2_9PEZI|nr:hypothetical protein B0T14DRAFT_572499 [Immersiella caudata]